MNSHRKAPISRKALWEPLERYPEALVSPHLGQIRAMLPDYACQSTLEGISVLSYQRLNRARVAEATAQFPGALLTWTNDWRALILFSLDSVS